jgi:transcriptional regulator with XRE-family HTH domain
MPQNKINNKVHEGWSTEGACPVGVVIRQRRHRLYMSLTDLAKLVGVSKVFLYRVEKNVNLARPSYEVLEKIATHLQLDPVDLSCLAGRLHPDVEAYLLKNPPVVKALVKASTQSR